MHLQKLEIDGFKCIDHLEFEPTKINVIIGGNDSGKTSLLEAIRIPHDPSVVDYYERLQYLISSGRERAKIKCRFDSDETNSEIKRPDEETFALEFKERIFEVLEDYLRSEKRGFTEATKEKIGLILEDESSKDLMKSLRSKSIRISVNGDECGFTAFKNTNSADFNRMTDLFGKIIVAIHDKQTENPGMIDDESYALLIHPFMLNLQGPRQSEMADHIVYLGDLELPEKNYAQENREARTKEQDDFEKPRKGLKHFAKFNWDRAIKEYAEENREARTKEIENFIKSRNVLEGLVKFDLDRLIFDRDGKKDSMPFEFAGDGFQEMIRILWGLSDPDSENKIILMEEPDVGARPGFTSHLAEMIAWFSREKKCSSS